MTTAIQDLRYAVRTLTKRPGFTLAVVFTLALGIGAATVIFDLMNLFHWRKPPVERPGELVEIYTASPQAFVGPYGSLSWLDYLDYRDAAEAFSGLAAFQQQWLTLDGGRGAEETETWAVTGNFFEVLGLHSALGRLLTAEDDRTGAAPVAVLSYAQWQKLGADPDVLGESVRLAGQVLHVVGVAPEGFQGTFAGSRPGAFVSAHVGFEVLDPASKEHTDRGRQAWNVIGRLAAGTSRGQAEAELVILAGKLDEEHPVPNFERRISTLPLTLGHPVDQLRMRPTLQAFSAAIALLVLIVCANVANLLLSRAAARRREMGIRQSLGAHRRRLVRQLLTENLLLALAGGLTGLFAAFLVRSLMGVYFGPELVGDMRFDHRVLGLTALASFGVTLVFGLAPALVTTRIDLVTALKDAAAGGGGRRRLTAGPLLAVAQVALSLVLLASSALLVGNLWQFRNADLGFDGENLLMARVDVSQGSYSSEEGRRLFRRLRERAASIPGVRSAGMPLLVPPVFLDVTARLLLPEDPETVHASRLNFADAEFFPTLGLPLLQGRLFEPRDAESGHGVVVVNRLLAEKLWPGEPAVGRRVRTERARPGDPGTEYEVIGVVGSVSQFTWSREPEPVVYFDREQRYRPSLFVLLRTEGADPEGIFTALREELRQLDPDLALLRPRTYEAHRWDGLVEQRLQTQTMALFGVAGLVLALLGIFGVMSYAVSRQVREIGIRMAVGARHGDVLRWVLRRGLALALAGIAVGLVGSFWAVRLLQGWMSGLTAMDPVVLAGAAAVLLAASAGAVLLPAQRAARVDPLTALRQE